MSHTILQHRRRFEAWLNTPKLLQPHACHWGVRPVVRCGRVLNEVHNEFRKVPCKAVANAGRCVLVLRTVCEVVLPRPIQMLLDSVHERKLCRARLCKVAPGLRDHLYIWPRRSREELSQGGIDCISGFKDGTYAALVQAAPEPAFDI